MKETKIVILNNDECNEVMGILTLKNMDYHDFDKLFTTYKAKLEDDWSWNGFLEWLKSCEIWDFTWENHDVESNIWQYSV